MKILLVTQLPPPAGGIATWSREYLAYMKKTEHQVSVVNMAAIGGRSQDVNASKDLRTELRRCRKIWSSIRRICREEQFDLVHFNVVGSKTGMLRDLVSMCLLDSSLPKVVEFHSSVQNMLGGSSPGEKLLKAICRKADTVLVLNSTTAAYIQEKTTAEPVIVSNFVDDRIILREEKQIHQELRNVIFTGHIVEEKGIREILQAAAACPDLTFRLMGKNSRTWENCPENVIFEGEHPFEEVLEGLNQADVFLFPSYSEGFSVSLTEAMARGLPAVASDVGANRDMLENKGGILIPAGSWEEIVKALESLRPQGRRREMSQWNVQKVRTCYRSDVVFEELLSLYYHMTEKGKENG